MRAYEGLGPSLFWEQYRREMKEADEKIVMPVLTALNAEVHDNEKWRQDGNGFPFWIGARGYEVLFDFEEVPCREGSAVGRILWICLRTHTTQGYVPLAEMSVELPRNDFRAMLFLFSKTLATVRQAREDKDF